MPSLLPRLPLTQRHARLGLESPRRGSLESQPKTGRPVPAVIGRSPRQEHKADQQEMPSPHSVMDSGQSILTFALDDELDFEADKSEPQLETLWLIAFPDQMFLPDSLEWLKLGFQTSDPTKDLRAAGLTGLRQLIHFCQSTGACPLHLVLTSQTSFPLSIASLNITLLLLQFFGLCNPSGGSGAIEQCSDATMRCAKRLQLTLPGVCLLDIIHSHLCRNLFDRWRMLEASLKRPILFEFPALLRAVGQHLQHSVTRLPEPWSLSSVLLAIRTDSQLLTEGGMMAGACDCDCGCKPPSLGKANGKSRSS